MKLRLARFLWRPGLGAARPAFRVAPVLRLVLPCAHQKEGPRRANGRPREPRRVNSMTDPNRTELVIR